MAYTYEVAGNPPMAEIKLDGQTIDLSGPWESAEAASAWAQMYTAKLNLGLEQPQ